MGTGGDWGMSQKPLVAFIAALRANVFAAMSGGFSVPFAAFSVFSPEKYQQAIWGLLAVCSFGFAAWRVWLYEHQKVTSLQAKLKLEGEPERDVSMDDAIGYVSLRNWNIGFSEAASSPFTDTAKDYDAVLQALADGKLPAWGKKASYGVQEPIPAEYWRTHRIDWFSLMRREPHTEKNGERYSELMTSRSAVERKWPPMGSPGSISSLGMAFASDGAHSRIGAGSIHNYEKILSIRLENIGSKALTNCKLVVESCDVETGMKFPITLADGISLPAGDHIFLALVKYGEARDPKYYDCADSFVTLMNNHALINVGESAVLTLRATGVDTPPRIAKCRTYVNNDGRVQIQRERS